MATLIFIYLFSEYPHIGYNLDGKKLIKPKQGDKLDDFLRRMEDPDFWYFVTITLTTLF